MGFWLSSRGSRDFERPSIWWPLPDVSCAPVLIYRTNSFSRARWPPSYFVNFWEYGRQRLRRRAARLRTTAIKNVNANSVLHMPTSPHCRRHNGFLFCDFFWMGIHVAVGITCTWGWLLPSWWSPPRQYGRWLKIRRQRRWARRTRKRSSK